MENSPQFRKGKQHYQYLMAFVIALALTNTIYEVIFGLSYLILGIQALLFVLTLVISFSLLNGHKRKNVFFAFLFLTGVFAFYQAGARMPDMRKTDITFPPIVTLCGGMGFIFAGIYLSYSAEIGVFLRTLQEKRTQRLQKNL